MPKAHIHFPEDKLADFCRRNRVRKLAFFGSVLRDDFRPDSDIDILVEFQPGTHVGLRFFDMERELSSLIGRKVDLNTPGFLGKDFRHRVISEAEVCYVAS
jgi:uncharacterized protein